MIKVDAQTPVEIIRAALAELPAGAAWPAGKAPLPDEVFTPARQKNVLDVARSLVVGNRGVGKTFWSHALSAPAARHVAATAYGLPQLRKIDAVFGFKGTIADNVAPSSTVLGEALSRTNDTLIVWQSILLRALGPPATTGLPNDLTDLTSWFSANPEAAERRIRLADEQRSREQRPLLVLFDALDTLATDWTEIRRRTEGLLRLAVLAKGLSATHIKIFMRPDQFADASLFRFPDASKLRAERVELQWSFVDLYALMFFHLSRHPAAREALIGIGDAPDIPQMFSSDGISRLGFIASSENAQRACFVRLAGPWMGSSRKRGATYSWLVQHLADARGETTPRGFLTALRVAAQYQPERTDLAIDYRGIQNGVAEASDNRVDDLLQDYWWIDYVKDPLVGFETPLERERLFETWRQAGTTSLIKTAARKRGLIPVYLALRINFDQLPREMAIRLESDEAALLETLRLIGVAEIRTSGKVNFPDIFRVAFKMKRRGGVPPKKVAAA
jgi:hypothetical protein